MPNLNEIDQIMKALLQNQKFFKNHNLKKRFKYQKIHMNKSVLELHCTPREQISFESYSNQRS